VNKKLLRIFKIHFLLITVGFVGINFASGQSGIEIRGKITDNSGQGIPGANVQVEGTKIGAISNLDGNYTITVPSQESVLIYSFIGFLSEKILVGQKNTIDIVLIEDIQKLSEVVVIGYGTMKKADLTGAVSTVDAEDMQKLAVTDVGEALQGRAAGVMVSKSSGKPGAGSEIKIRGINSINQTDPLWVVDGVKGAPIGSMDDVESISILKDAAAAAIYGKEGANGVIIVTTKRGEKGSSKVNFHAYTSWNFLPEMPDLLNANQYAETRIKGLLNGGTEMDVINDSYGYYLQNFDQSTNWKDEIFRAGQLQNYTLSGSGGTEKANYYVSGNIVNQTGNVIENNYSSYNFKINTDLQINDWLRIGESVNFRHSDETPLNQRQGERIYRQLYRALPSIPVYDDTNINGGGFGYAPDSAQWNGANPVANYKLYDGFRKKDRFFANVYAEIRPFESLSWRTDISGRYGWDKNEDLFYPFYHINNNQDPRNEYRYQLTESMTQRISSFLTFNKNIGLHGLSLMQGFEAEENHSSSIQTSAIELNSLLILDADQIDDQIGVESSQMDKGHIAEFGYFGRLTYGYNEKYLFQANYRYDYSVKFGSAYAAGLFPSFSAGWRISKEPFMRQYSWLSDLKIRGGWGITGIDNIGQYKYQLYYADSQSGVGAAGYQDFGGVLYQALHIREIPNNTIKWEEVEQLNIGVDFALYSNKLSGSVDYYKKTTTDMLIPLDIPTQTGFSSFLGNKATNLNQGVDLIVSYKSNLGNAFLSVSGNATYNNNEVIDLQSTEDSPNFLTSGSIEFSPINRTQEQYSIASFYGFLADGIITSQEQIDALNEAAPDGTYQNAGTQPGDILYRDIASRDANGNIVMVPDGQITEEDQTFIGSPWPDWIFGLNVNLTFKSFDFNMQFTGQQGNKIFNEVKVWTDQMYGDANTSTAVLDAWSLDNPNGVIPRLTSSDLNENFIRPSTYFIENGSFVRLKNIQIGYTLPSTIANKIFTQNLRVYVSALNLLTFTSYSGIDPEFVNQSTSNKRQGVDQIDNYPQFKSYTLGIQVEF